MIRTKPLPHHKQVIEFCAPLSYAGIGASYGLGKTYCALSIVELNGWKVVLVISTKTAIQSTWPEQITEHSNYFYVTLVGSSKDKLRIARNSLIRFAAYAGQKRTIIFLTNFDGAKNIFPLLKALKPQALFIDESRKIKNAGSLRSKVMWALSKYVPNRFIMTGFPVSDGFGTEIYSQVKFLDHGATFGNSYAGFLKEYFKKTGGKWKLKRGAGKRIYNKIKDFWIMIPETAIKMPPKTYRKIGLEPTDLQKSLFAKLDKNMRDEFASGTVNTMNVYAMYTKALEVCDGFIMDNGRVRFFESPKDEALIDIIKEIGDEKVLIWTVFVPTLFKLQRILTRLGYGVLTLYGDTEDPGKVVKAFQGSPKYNVLLSTISKGNESITLTACRTAIYYGRWWSFDQRDNSEARIRRIGSEKHSSIMYCDLYLKGTMEEKVDSNYKTKIAFIKDLKKQFTPKKEAA